MYVNALARTFECVDQMPVLCIPDLDARIETCCSHQLPVFVEPCACDTVRMPCTHSSCIGSLARWPSQVDATGLQRTGQMGTLLTIVDAEEVGLIVTSAAHS